MFICCNKKGTHAIQAMFDLVNLPEEEEQIKDCIRGKVYSLALDQQGTHVVQKVITSFAESKWEFVFDEIYENFIELAMHNHGLCVVKKLVQYTKDQGRRAMLMEKLSENAVSLVQNPYGNYAVTEVLSYWESQQCQPIFKKLKNKVCQLSIQKFSSNVIEKCLQAADEAHRSQIIEEIY